MDVRLAHQVSVTSVGSVETETRPIEGFIVLWGSSGGQPQQLDAEFLVAHLADQAGLTTARYVETKTRPIGLVTVQ